METTTKQQWRKIKVPTRAGEWGPRYEVRDESGALVAEDLDRATAYRIVYAVNSHADLAAALEGILRADDRGSTLTTSQVAARDVARAALAAARGEAVTHE